MPYLGKSPTQGVRQRYQYTATAGQTTFSGTDSDNLTLTYTDANFVDVYQNGVLLNNNKCKINDFQTAELFIMRLVLSTMNGSPFWTFVSTWKY